MMRSVAVSMGAPLALLVVLGAARPASADVFQLRAEIHGGAAGGVGFGGAQKDNAFFRTAPHGAYGALIGAQFLFADAYIEHTQLTNGSRIATWTAFALGMRIDMPTGRPPMDKEHPHPKATGYFDLGLHAVFGLGTGQQVQPPLDNAQITDKGFLFEIRGSYGKLLGHGLRIGIEVPVSVGYFFKSGNGATANDLGTHYQGVQAAALLTFGLQLGK